MASSFQSAINSLAGFAIKSQATQYSKIYAENCHKIYSLAFWMTDNEQAAEELSSNIFLRAFATVLQPAAEHLDRAFMVELRELMHVGVLSLEAIVSAGTKSIRGNTKRIHLERAVVQLPPTERLIFLLHDVESYEHSRIAHLLGISEDDSILGLHLARIRIRELVAQMS